MIGVGDLGIGLVGGDGVPLVLEAWKMDGGLIEE